ncbi:MAG: DUF1254 domain-containing protein [Proteobacteria bacterium]|nr:DUF1254 domain-containing protein [Pseudomonadota bacterium]
MKFVYFSLITVSLAFFLHILFVYYLPNVAMLIAFHHMKYNNKVGTNTFFHSGIPTPRLRNVPKPDPNLFYSLCTYDVSKYPVRFTAPIPDTSWSISFYARNGSNFYATNDQTFGSKEFNLILTGKKNGDRFRKVTHKIIAPSDKGMAIIRSSIMNQKDPDKLVQLHKQVKCTPLNDQHV